MAGRPRPRAARGGWPLRTAPGNVALLVAVAVLVVSVSIPVTGLPSRPQRAIVASVLLTAPADPAVGPAISGHFPHPQWVNVTSTVPGAAPPPASGVAAAYDPADHETVYFGGCLAVGPCPDNQTWVFANGTWANVTQHADAPSAREYAAMDYDANLNAILLFGGEGNNSTPLNDTWTFRGGVWSNVSYYSPAPPAGEGASMAFDPQPEENGSVLFGGCVVVFIFQVCSNETWVWRGGAGWVELNASVPPTGRGFASMAYDPTDGYVVLFGGVTGLSVLGDTWELYSGQWWNVTPSDSPPALTQGGMVYDPGLPGLVLFGGLNASIDYTAETWTFAAGAWTHQSPAASPPAMSLFGVGLDATGSTPLVVGGENATTAFNTTWAYEFPPEATVAPSVSAAEVHENVTFTVTIEDGTPPYRAAVDLGDGSYAYLAGPGPTLSATHAYPAAGNYSVSAEVIDAVGASSTAGFAPFGVTPGPAVTVTVAPSLGEAGRPVSFRSAAVPNASVPVNYSWSFGDRTVGYGEDPSHTYAAAGTYTAEVTATDAAHVSTSASVSVTIVAAPVVRIAPIPASPGEGVPVTFYSSVSGGLGPFNYSWTFGDGSDSSLAQPVHAYAKSGTYTVAVTLTDGRGGTASATTSVTVPSPAAPLFGPLSGAPDWFWGALGGLAVVAAVGSVLLLRRGRRPPARPPP